MKCMSGDVLRNFRGEPPPVQPPTLMSWVLGFSPQGRLPKPQWSCNRTFKEPQGVIFGTFGGFGLVFVFRGPGPRTNKQQARNKTKIQSIFRLNFIWILERFQLHFGSTLASKNVLKIRPVFFIDFDTILNEKWSQKGGQRDLKI